VLQAWFDGLSFATLADSFSDHSLCELDLDVAHDDLRAEFSLASGCASSLAPRLCDRAQLTLRNVVPAPFIRPRLELADSVVMFSATLNPPDYDRHLLGLPDDTTTLTLNSPFDPANLRVSVLPVSTRITDRSRTLPRVVAAMAREYRREPGNYLAFFSSFDYLQQAFHRFCEHHPDITAWAQTRAMTEAERSAFLNRFTPEGQGIGFAVLGGAFGEGVDLPGRRLIGAFIATLGMPQIDPVNEAIAERLEKLFGAGHDYTYLIPGLQKVVQAAGRVIRSPEDRGSLLLIDARYSWPRYQQLLPSSWGLG
jgi:Rad3-related DNA helicase